jgi:hypothetical protein
LNAPASPAYNDYQLGWFGEMIMDERQIQHHGLGQRGLVPIRPLVSQGLEAAGIREHEVLLAEGYYRCPHCRRPDLNERIVAPTRMR